MGMANGYGACGRCGRFCARVSTYTTASNCTAWWGDTQLTAVSNWTFHRDEFDEAAARDLARRASLEQLRQQRLRDDGVAFFGMHAPQPMVRFGMHGFGKSVRFPRSNPPPKFATYQGDF